jgi:hypothetical protein
MHGASVGFDLLLWVSCTRLPGSDRLVISGLRDCLLGYQTGLSRQ